MVRIVTASGPTSQTPAPSGTLPGEIYLDKKPNTIAAGDFNFWSSVSQISYLNKWGTGDPKSVVIGKDNSFLVFTLSADGKSITSAAPPGSFTAAAGDLTPGTFERWPLAAQRAYIEANGTGDPKSVSLGTPPGSAGVAVFTHLYGQEVGVTVFTETARLSDLTSRQNTITEGDLFYDFEGEPRAGFDLEWPSNFNTAPSNLTPQEFGAWPSVIQRAYLRKNGNQSMDMRFVLTLGPSGNQCTAFLSNQTTPARVYVIEALDKPAIMKMSDTDRAFLIRQASFRGADGVANKLGLVINSTSDGNAGNLRNKINALRANIDGAGENGSTKAMREAFKAEFDLILNTVPETGVFSETEVMRQAQQIDDRWYKYSQFTYALYVKQTCTLDDNESIVKMTAELERQETTILAAARRKADVAGSGTLSGFTKNLDLPSLIFTFQLCTYQISEGTLRYQAEEMNQLNEFIKLIGVMQTGINNIIKKSDPKSDSKIPVTKAYENDSAFEKSFTTASKLFVGDYKHPLEKIYKISRSKDDLGDKTSNQWATYGQQLADRANTLNQQSQVLMNKYNSDTKAKDRFYDLANTALSKMNDTIQKISNAM